MRGAAERDRRAMKMVVAQAWWSANLDGSKLKPLKHYHDMLEPRKPQTNEEVMAVFREHQARGAAIKITHILASEVN